MTQISQVKDLKLPEGLLWNSELMCFEFVDILSGSIYRYDVSLNSTKLLKRFASTIGWLFPTQRPDQYICGLQNKIVLWNARTDMSTNLCVVDIKNGQRINDALLVEEGSKVLFGVMSSSTPENVQDGALYSFSSKGLIKEDENYLIPNGPIITKDQCSMLHSDSAKGLVYRYPYKDGVINTKFKKVALDVSDIGASPDGMCIDELGSIYIAMWGAGEIWKFNSKFNFEKKFTIPYRYVTNVAFGGEELDDLLVSYAEDKELGLSGGVFHVKGHGAKGVRPCKWCN